uniref:dolichyl-P-Man:Man5GlcNAc2-PP-dolichol alpha-1,3-mannosyltransferase n=1 Tax=Cacopsylla melanoneura TaxID=428564 RepID=A0A8D8ZYX8_9HEMI
MGRKPIRDESHWAKVRKTARRLVSLDAYIKTFQFFRKNISDPRTLPYFSIVILLMELLINVYVVNKVKYTEIDWKAYMQEVEGVINGTFDYSKLKGDTGPLVYPAGFVWIYTGLYYLTDKGTNIRLAQYIYIGLYIAMLALVLNIYCKTKKVPPHVLMITIFTSYRIHSIFVLRLFNDPLAVLLFYISLNLFLVNKWSLGSAFFSLAVSVKMNILLYAPALLLAYLICLGYLGTLKQLFICAFLQLFFALPFLIENPIAYLKGSFDLGRVFLHQWTVNYRFLPEFIFTSPYFHIGLLITHILLLAVFFKSWTTYLNSYHNFKSLESNIKKQVKDNKANLDMTIATNLLVLPLLVANFIGIVCARSLHYQFYVWYYHSLPYLLWSTTYSNKLRYLILGVIELCWNTYPSTIYSSTALHVCHLVILYGLYRSRYVKSKNS